RTEVYDSQTQVQRQAPSRSPIVLNVRFGLVIAGVVSKQVVVLDAIGIQTEQEVSHRVGRVDSCETVIAVGRGKHGLPFDSPNEQGARLDRVGTLHLREILRENLFTVTGII